MELIKGDFLFPESKKELSLFKKSEPLNLLIVIILITQENLNF